MIFGKRKAMTFFELIEREILSDEYWRFPPEPLPKPKKAKTKKAETTIVVGVEPYWEFRVGLYDTPESIIVKYPNTERLRETCRRAGIHASGHRDKLAQRLFDQFEYRAGPIGYYDEDSEIFTPEEIASASRMLSFFF